MSLSALCRRITEFGFKLLENGFALDARVHVVANLTATRSSLVWTRNNPNASLIIDDPARIMDYVTLLEGKEYSFLMHDGAIVQISYIFERDTIYRHRLVYYPCPLSLDPSLIADQQQTLSDLIREVYLNDLERSVALKSPIRFDFAPYAAADYHPASHMTFNAQTCRIPVRSPIRFDQFMKFVLENFYPHVLRVESVAKAILGAHDAECLSDHDRRRIHLTWSNA